MRIWCRVTDIAPMNMREAVEVMKIIGPHAQQFTETTEPLKIMHSMIDEIKADTPIQVMRLLALMEHKSVEDLAEEMQESTGVDLLERLSAGFRRNDLVNLVNAAFYLGIASERWVYVE